MTSHLIKASISAPIYQGVETPIVDIVSGNGAIIPQGAMIKTIVCHGNGNLTPYIPLTIGYSSQSDALVTLQDYLTTDNINTNDIKYNKERYFSATVDSELVIMPYYFDIMDGTFEIIIEYCLWSDL